MPQKKRASVGWLNSTGFEGALDTNNVTYHQSPTGTQGIRVYGLQPHADHELIGIQIDFPRDAELFEGSFDIRDAEKAKPGSAVGNSWPLEGHPLPL